jgi:hypothetical protein
MIAYRNYPQNPESMEEVVRRIAATRGIEDARHAVSMSDISTDEAQRLHDMLDSLEPRQSDAMAVEGDISDMGGY